MLSIKRKNIFIASYFSLFFIIFILRAYRPITDWVATHWVFNYELEFVKRGLIGEIIRVFIGDISRDKIAIMANVAVFAFYFFICYVFFKLLKVNKLKSGGLVLFLFFASHPAVMHFFADVGRFDCFVLILMLMAGFVIRFSNHGLFKDVFVFSVFFVSAVLHEASVFMTFPMIVSFYFLNDKSELKYSFFKMLLLLVFFFAILFFIYKFGGVSSMDLQSHLNYLVLKYGDWISLSSLKVIHEVGVSENIALTVRRGLSFERLLQHFVFVFSILLPLFILYKKVLSGILFGLSRKEVLFLISAISPLALYPAGHDHFRWWSIAMVNFFIAFCYILHTHPSEAKYLSASVLKNRRLMIGGIFFSLIIGPVGIMESFNIKLVEKKLGLEPYPPLLLSTHPDYKK